jgi:GT2 family glycosyltransferase
MTATEPLPLSVAVVSFNTRDILATCLESVAATAPTRTVVIDTGSTDGSIELVRERYPNVLLLVNDENRGYGAAANQAIGACTTPAVLLLNSDTILAPNALLALGRYLAEHPLAAVIGPRLANADGSLQRSTYGFPSPGDTLLGETGLHLLVRRIPALRERFWRTWSHDAARPVPWVLGAVLAIRRSAFDAVGGFDDAFFMYGEEVDLCRRLERAGFETHFAPVTTVVHLGGASTAKRRVAMRRELLLSRRRFLLQHASPRSAARVLRVLRTIAAARLIRDAILLRVARDPERRPGLRDSAASWRALLEERSLWKP